MKFNKQVITEEFNRVVAEELARHIDPNLPGKTLIFAVTDAHADIVVDANQESLARPLWRDRRRGHSQRLPAVSTGSAS